MSTTVARAVHAAPAPVPARIGSLRWLFEGALTLLFAAFIGLLLSIGIEWIGMAAGWWSRPGAEHSAWLLEQELARLYTTFNETGVIAPPAETASWMAGRAYVYTGMSTLVTWVTTPITPVPPSPDRLASAAAFWQSVKADFHSTLVVIQQGLHAVGEYIVAAANIVQLFGARLAVTLMSLPVFAITAAVGVIDGLVQRDLRRYGGGIESSFLYHHLKPLLKPLVWLPALVYLASPWSLHPTAVFVPPALLFGWVLAKTASRFKKYL